MAQSSTSYKSRVGFLSSLWFFASKNSELPTDIVKNLNAQLLSVLLLTFATGFGFIDIYKSITMETYMVPWPGYLTMAFAFFLNRYYSYRIAAILTCIMFPAVLFSLIVIIPTPDNIQSLQYLVLAAILSALLLKGWESFLFSSSIVVGILLIPVLFSTVLLTTVITPLGVFIFGWVLAHLLRFQRNAIEARRQRQHQISESRIQHFIDDFHGIAYEIDLKNNAFNMFRGNVKGITGQTQKHFSGNSSSWQQLIRPEDKTVYAEEQNKLLLLPFHTTELEYRITHGDGSVRWVRDLCHKVEDENGAYSLLRGALFDITDTRLINERLRQSEKMEAVGQLAGGVAHDFNNQLVGIVGYADLLMEDFPDQPELHEYAQGILSASHTASDLVNQLLAFARKGKYQTVMVDLPKIIKEVTGLLKHTIAPSIIIKQGPVEVGASTLGDPSQIQSALLNLALNARDAMPSGGELTFAVERVTLDEEYCNNSPHDIKPGCFIQISVSDTGSGIDKEAQKHIFEPFFTTKEQGKGTGLGLAAVYGTVKSHKGSISVYSEIGIGTTFKIYLPSGQNQSPEQGPQPDTAGTHESERVRILLIDDEKIVLNMASTMLRQMGHTVTIARGGADGIDLYKSCSQSIDLVILDLIMPEINGGEVFAVLKNFDPEVKVLLASGYSLNNTAHKLMEDGVKGFIQKPYRKNELAKKIAEVMGNK